MKNRDKSQKIALKECYLFALDFPAQLSEVLGFLYIDCTNDTEKLADQEYIKMLCLVQDSVTKKIFFVNQRLYVTIQFCKSKPSSCFIGILIHLT